MRGTQAITSLGAVERRRRGALGRGHARRREHHADHDRTGQAHTVPLAAGGADDARQCGVCKGMGVRHDAQLILARSDKFVGVAIWARLAAAFGRFPSDGSRRASAGSGHSFSYLPGPEGPIPVARSALATSQLRTAVHPADGRCPDAKYGRLNDAPLDISVIRHASHQRRLTTKDRTSRLHGSEGSERE